MAAKNDEIPKQVHVRTDPEAGLAYRYDVIQEAADRFDCNKTDAIVRACDVAMDVPLALGAHRRTPWIPERNRR